MKKDYLIVIGFVTAMIGFGAAIYASGVMKSLLLLLGIASILMTVHWQKNRRRVVSALIVLTFLFASVGIIGLMVNSWVYWVKIALTMASVMAFGGYSFVMLKILLQGKESLGHK
ncbi:hypothetical protein [Thermomonas sp. HDW16]|uniref:hypothetical protein n=1 Tax=Thermomonas sp. HDW16 TaxID=2714945 RepID=UPI00140B62BB|nr:hypothetical protein [Thermomonas sp. HDW16]QIL21156.1 hypothetical protein G7079_10675 [Thermomonas sp. HDW16]